MDGSFTDLNSEIVEGDCEDFWREIYKINKIFTNQIKKRKIELQAKLSEKRKSKSNKNSILSYLHHLDMVDSFKCCTLFF